MNFDRICQLALIVIALVSGSFGITGCNGQARSPENGEESAQANTRSKIQDPEKTASTELKSSQRWNFARMKDSSVGYGKISEDGESIIVEGVFSDEEYCYVVLDEQERYVLICNDDTFGWVRKDNLIPIGEKQDEPSSNDEDARLLIGEPLSIVKWDAKFRNADGLVTGIGEIGVTLHAKAKTGNQVWLKERPGQWIAMSDVLPFEKATQLFDRMVAETGTAKDLLGRGSFLLNRRQLKKSLADLDEAIRIDPDMAFAIMMRGLVYNELDEYTKAIVDFDNAIQLDPDPIIVYRSWQGKGVAQYEMGEYQLAVTALGTALNLLDESVETRAAEGITRQLISSDYVNVYAHRGFARQKLGKYELAIEDLTEAIRLDPDNEVHFGNRGNVWELMGRHDEAIEDFSRSIRADPGYLRSWYSRGIVRDRCGDFENAISDFDEVIRQDPRHAEAYYCRGESWRGLDEYRKTIRDFRKSIQVAPGYHAPCEMLALVLSSCEVGEFRNGKEAIELATRSCELTRWKDDISIIILGMAHAETGDFDKALECLDRAAQMARQNEKLLIVRLREKFQRGEPHRESR